MPVTEPAPIPDLDWERMTATFGRLAERGGPEVVADLQDILDAFEALYDAVSPLPEPPALDLTDNETWWTTIGGMTYKTPAKSENRYRRSVTTVSFATKEETVARWLQESGTTKLIPGQCGDTVVTYGDVELVREGGDTRDSRIEAIADAWRDMNPAWPSDNARRELAAIALDALDDHALSTR